MSDFGFQTFIEGTSFNAVETMLADRYLIDAIAVPVTSNGSGSKTYNNLPEGVQLVAEVSRGRQIASYAPASSVTVSGNVVTWANTNQPDMVLVYGE